MQKLKDNRFGSTHIRAKELGFDELGELVVFNRSIHLLERLGATVTTMASESPEELFMRYYNHEKVAVKDMDIPTLRAHLDELSKVAFEARARLQAVRDSEREKHASLNSQQRSWIAPANFNDETHTNAIKVVEKRKERMNKFEKLRLNMLAIGMSETDVNKHIAEISKSATEKQVDTVTFNKEKKATLKEVAPSIKPIEPSKPVDFSKLSFLKKTE